MRVYLLNRSDVCVFCGEKLLPVRKEGGREYIEADVREGEWLTLRFFRCSELSSRLWPLYALFFWVIGLFGLFTPRYAKFSHRLDCTAHIAAGARPPVLRFTHYLGSAEKPIPAGERTEKNASALRPVWIAANQKRSEANGRAALCH